MLYMDYVKTVDISFLGPVAKYLNIQSRKPIPNIMDPPGIDLLKGWLDECVQEHSNKCQGNYHQEELPSRLVFLGSNSDNATHIEPRVVEVDLLQGISGHGYAALSYCWGPDKNPLQTLKNNLECMKTSIRQRGSIPKTIGDGIKVAKELGIAYLWVDALCIVQDDPIDKETEIPKMAAIYGNAFVTIVAAGAFSATDGFIHNKTVNALRGIPFQSRKYPTISGYIYIEPSDTRDTSNWHFETQVNDSKWNTRGWTFQERYLSSRLLYFGQNSVHYHCNAQYSSEISLETHDIGKTVGRTTIRDWKNSSEAYDEWYRLAMLYSKRELSDSRDKLTAISALARQMHFALKETGEEDQYLAGLWKKDLIKGLLWKVERTRSSLPTSNRNSGPTWSWATRNTDVVWLNCEHECYRRHLECCVSGAGLSLRTNDVFSEVQSGFVVLTGRLKRFEDTSRNRRSDFFQYRWKKADREKAGIKPRIDFDFEICADDEQAVGQMPGWVGDTGDVWLLFLNAVYGAREWAREESLVVCGLALKLRSNTVTREFERVGIFMSEPEMLANPQAETALWTWIATWPNETIRIL
jgi:hypothetical protein